MFKNGFEKIAGPIGRIMNQLGMSKIDRSQVAESIKKVRNQLRAEGGGGGVGHFAKGKGELMALFNSKGAPKFTGGMHSPNSSSGHMSGLYKNKWDSGNVQQMKDILTNSHLVTGRR